MMTNSDYKLIPLQETLSIPVNWEFSQADFNRLSEGHKSNWVVFQRDNTVHFCRIGGEEFYRFVMVKQADGSYLTDSLQTYIVDKFLTSLREKGASEAEIKKKQSGYVNLVLEETTGLLQTYFGITVPAKIH